MNTKKQSENTNTFSEQTKRLEQQINFIREMDKEKFIGRQTYLSDGKRKENDAEHAWHLALMTFLLSEYANEPIDVLKTMVMVLFHDVVEIDAGDMYAYDEDGKNTPESRFAHTMDNLQPVILNAATNGKAWKEHGVYLSQFMGRQEDTPKGSEVLWQYEWEKLVEPFLKNGTIKDDSLRE